MSSEKFCLKWNDFQKNIGISFGELRDDKDFSDVTLACEDADLEAHKVVLSSCSPFFRRLFKRGKHKHPIIYMRGLKADQLKAVVDFIYFGEVNIVQEKLEPFLELAKDLELKGLVGTDAEQTEEPKTTLLEPKPELKGVQKPKNTGSGQLQSATVQPVVEPCTSDFDYEQGLVPATELKMKTTKVHIDEDTFRKRDTLFQIQEHGVWACNVCSFTSSNRGTMREHVEKHMEGLEFPCDHCGKIKRSSMSLRKHYNVS